MLKSKQNNIAEYILYLWQMEDYLRAFPQNADATPELHELNEMMHREGIVESGHLQLAQNALAELEDLHAQLSDEDAMYRAAIIRLQPSPTCSKPKPTARPCRTSRRACCCFIRSCCYVSRKKRSLLKQPAFNNKPPKC